MSTSSSHHVSKVSCIPKDYAGPINISEGIKNTQKYQASKSLQFSIGDNLYIFVQLIFMVYEDLSPHPLFLKYHIPCSVEKYIQGRADSSWRKIAYQEGSAWLEHWIPISWRLWMTILFFSVEALFVWLIGGDRNAWVTEKRKRVWFISSKWFDVISL